jgi:hypothetical protein
VYAEVPGRVAEYYVSAWPEYIPTGVIYREDARFGDRVIPNRILSLRDIHPPKNISGPYQLVFYSLQGREVSRMSGTISSGTIMEKGLISPVSSGVYRLVLSCGKWRVEGEYSRINSRVGKRETRRSENGQDFIK